MITGFIEAVHLFQDIWSLYKRYAAKRSNEAELEKFMGKVSAIYEKYKTPFAKEILLAVVGEIERTVRFYNKWEKGERNHG